MRAADRAVMTWSRSLPHHTETMYRQRPPASNADGKARLAPTANQSMRSARRQRIRRLPSPWSLMGLGQ